MSHGVDSNDLCITSATWCFQVFCSNYGGRLIFYLFNIKSGATAERQQSDSRATAERQWNESGETAEQKRSNSRATADRQRSNSGATMEQQRSNNGATAAAANR